MYRGSVRPCTSFIDPDPWWRKRAVGEALWGDGRCPKYGMNAGWGDSKQAIADLMIGPERPGGGGGGGGRV
jgi:hypothetical protein